MCTFAAQTFSMNMQEDKSIIEVSHVSKFFGDKTALDDVTLNVKKGEFVTVSYTHLQHGINDGVEVLHRSDYNDSEVADGIKDTITLFADKSEKEVKEIRKRAADVAEQALWKHFIQYYYEAYDIALRNALKRQLS